MLVLEVDAEGAYVTRLVSSQEWHRFGSAVITHDAKRQPVSEQLAGFVAPIQETKRKIAEVRADSAKLNEPMQCARE